MSNSIAKILRAKYDLIEKASVTGDIRGMVKEVYSSQFVTAGQDSATVQNVDQLVEVLEQLIGGGARLKMTAMFGGGEMSGDLAYGFTLNEVTPLGGGELMCGKSLMVWRREGDDWRCVADMFAMGVY